MSSGLRESIIQKRRNELIGRERSQIVDTFPNPEKPERQRALESAERDRAHHAAPRRAVQLRQNQPGEAERVVESPDLAVSVLAGVRVEHQPCLMSATRFGLDRKSVV